MVYKVILKHRLGILISFLIGLIFFLPHLLMPILQDGGVDYQPIVVKGASGRLTDEVLYIGYVHDVMEGHLIPRSTVWEWQNKNLPIHAAGPIPAIVLGNMAKLLGIEKTYMASFFIFPFLGALLMYSVAFLLSSNKKVSCMAAPLLYFPISHLRLLISDNAVRPMSYLSRFYPVLFNFVMFALALLSLLLLLKRKEWKYVPLAGATGGLLFFTYFYYWTFYASALIFLLAILLLKKENGFKKILASSILTFIFGVLFFFAFEQNNVNEKADTFLRYYNFQYSHAPNVYFSLFLIITIMLYVSYIYYSKKDKSLDENVYFIVAFLASGLVVINTQIILGFTLSQRQWLEAAIWPVLILTTVHISSIWLSKIKLKLSRILPFAVTLFFLLFGIIWQISFAATMHPVYTLPDYQQEAFIWLNKNTKPDEVVLSLASDTILLIPVHTHNQNFIPSARGESIPLSEVLFRRLVAYKLLNVSTEDFVFLNKPCFSSRNFLSYSDGEKINTSAYEEGISHLITFDAFFSNNGCSVPTEFKDKMKNLYASLPTDQNQLINFFKLDYIIVGPYEKELLQTDLSNIADIQYQDENVTIYEVSEPAEDRP